LAVCEKTHLMTSGITPLVVKTFSGLFTFSVYISSRNWE